LLALSCVAFTLAPLGLRYSVSLRLPREVRPCSCFASHGYPLRGLLFAPCQQLRCMTRSKAGRKRLFVTSLKHCYAAFREPRHFDPRYVSARASTTLARRVAVAYFVRQAHGLRPHLHPRTLGRPQGSAHSTSTSRLRQCLSCVICSPLGFGGSPAPRRGLGGSALNA
jgi:hypothetical protein